MKFRDLYRTTQLKRMYASVDRMNEAIIANDPATVTKEMAKQVEMRGRFEAPLGVPG